MIKISDIYDARERISPYIYKTPILRQKALDDILGCQVYLKHEGLQVSGSFKYRGAMSKLTTLTDEELKRGIICASSGNHAMGVACAAKTVGTEAIVVMPTNGNPVKINGVKKYGGNLILEGTLTSERDKKADELSIEKNLVNIHSFGDDYVIAGQGTIALEILEDIPDMDCVIVPIGGGGLISGISTCIKQMRPRTKVYGVEPTGAPRYSESRKAGSPVKLEKVDTIADGTRTDCADKNNFITIEENVDEIFTVKDEWIKEAMYLLAEKAKIVVEPSSVMPIGAVLGGRVKFNKDDKVCFVLSGGNNDLSQFSEIIREMDNK